MRMLLEYVAVLFLAVLVILWNGEEQLLQVTQAKSASKVRPKVTALAHAASRWCSASACCGWAAWSPPPRLLLKPLGVALPLPRPCWGGWAEA